MAQSGRRRQASRNLDGSPGRVAALVERVNLQCRDPTAGRRSCWRRGPSRRWTTAISGWIDDAEHDRRIKFPVRFTDARQRLRHRARPLGDGMQPRLPAWRSAHKLCVSPDEGDTRHAGGLARSGPTASRRSTLRAQKPRYWPSRLPPVATIAVTFELGGRTRGPFALLCNRCRSASI
jgi:hypothetical protein